MLYDIKKNLIAELEQKTLTIEKINEIFAVYEDPSISGESINYLTYFKELKLKTEVGELRLCEYKMELIRTCKQTDADRYDLLDRRMNMQISYLDNLKKQFNKLGNLLMNFSKTLNNDECRIFMEIFIEQKSMKEVAIAEGLSYQRIRDIKLTMNRALKKIYVNEKFIKF